jgi:hypothetical protein
MSKGFLYVGQILTSLRVWLEATNFNILSFLFLNCFNILRIKTFREFEGYGGNGLAGSEDASESEREGREGDCSWEPGISFSPQDSEGSGGKDHPRQGKVF